MIPSLTHVIGSSNKLMYTSKMNKVIIFFPFTLLKKIESYTFWLKLDDSSKDLDAFFNE